MKAHALLLPFLILSVTYSHAQDSLMLAIKRSNPALVKKEIGIRSLTQNEQLLYLNFCDEVIIRRRNAIQFPQYYEGKPIYTKAFPTDEEPHISVGCGLRLIGGLFGSIIGFPYFLDAMYNSRMEYPKTAIAAEITALILLISAIVEIDENRKREQELLYENAIVIKHLISDVETI